jgi:hypothetical protein
MRAGLGQKCATKIYRRTAGPSASRRFRSDRSHAPNNHPVGPSKDPWSILNMLIFHDQVYS